MTDNPMLTFSFEGKLADKHLMDFYESSRFHYGAARLLYTINHLSETGRVPERITKKIYNQSFVIRPPEKGSWELVVMAYVGLKVADGVISYGVDYVMQTLFPLRKKLNETSELIKRTGRLTPEAEQLMAKIKGVRKETELELADDVLNYINKEIEETRFQDDVRNLMIGLEQAARRFKTAGIYENEILPKKLSLEQQYTLIDKTRVMFKEIGYPLNKSADELNLRHSNDNLELVTNTIFQSDIDSLAENIYETERKIITVKIKSFDKETGWLKVRVKGASGAKGLMVKKAQRTKTLFEILEAMKNDTVILSVYRVLKPVGSVAYYIFDEYLGEPQSSQG